MKGHSPVTDYVLVCSGTSDRQVRAIADAIARALKDKGCVALGMEGYNEGRWVLGDFGDVIVHVFHDDIRYFYDIEKLWPHAVEVDD